MVSVLSDQTVVEPVDQDASGLTCEEWDPTEDVDSSQMPVAMIDVACITS